MTLNEARKNTKELRSKLQTTQGNVDVLGGKLRQVNTELESIRNELNDSNSLVDLDVDAALGLAGRLLALELLQGRYGETRARLLNSYPEIQKQILHAIDVEKAVQQDIEFAERNKKVVKA